jgi:hypothetical protein
MLIWRTGSYQAAQGLDGGNVSVTWTGKDSFQRSWHTEPLEYASYLSEGTQAGQTYTKEYWLPGPPDTVTLEAPTDRDTGIEMWCFWQVCPLFPLTPLSTPPLESP